VDEVGKGDCVDEFMYLAMYCGFLNESLIGLHELS